MSSIENLKYHLVWCTKYRYKLLDNRMAKAITNYVLKKQDLFGYSVISLTIEPDHVYLLLQVENGSIDLNDLIRKLKRGSSFLLRKKFNQLLSYPALWTPSHFVASVGDVSSKSVTDYINSQGIQETEFVSRTFVYKVLDPNRSKLKQLDTWLKDVTCRPKGLQQRGSEKLLNGIFLRNDLIRIETRSDTKKASLWLRLPGGNGWKMIWIGLQGRKLPKSKLCDSKLVKNGNTWWAHLTVEQEVVIKNDELKSDIIGIDLGITHPITAVRLKGDKVKSVTFLGKRLKSITWKRQQRVAKLQKHGKTNIKKRTKRYYNQSKDCAHQYTAFIVKEAKEHDAVIAIGNLRGITKTWDKSKRKRNKTFRKKAKSTPYGRIMDQIFYKSTRIGIQTVFVDEAYTSKRCSLCNRVGIRKLDRFICTCGYTNQADINGAINIASVCRQGLNDWSLVPMSVSESEGNLRL